MTEIYFLRHGNSVANHYHKIAGIYDAGLTKKGRKQAKITAKALKNEHFDYIYSSNIPRAIATAYYVAKEKKQTVYIDSAFSEINFGVFEGLDYFKLLKAHPEYAIARKNDYANISYEGGESVKECAKRFKNAILAIAKKHEGKKILVATHSVALGNFISYLQANFDEDKIGGVSLENCSISKVESDGKEIKLVYFNDCSHLVGKI